MMTFTQQIPKLLVSILLLLILASAGSLSAEAGQYEPAVITCGSESMDAVRIGNMFYAYNPEMNFYIFHEFTLTKEKVDAYISDNGAILDWNAVYSSSSSDWSTGDDRMVFQTMKAFYRAAAFYRDRVGYQGIDGRGGCALVTAGANEDKVIAANYGSHGYVIFTSKKVIGSDELMVHEYGHALLKNVCSLNSENESGALHEAIADIFASLYEENPDWILGPADCQRNIPGHTYINIYGVEKNGVIVKSEYQYDRTSDYKDEVRYFDELGLIGNALDSIGIPQDLMGSNKHKYPNSFIISYTMCRIWDKLFRDNTDAFLGLLYDTCKYLAPDAGFSHFRDAFLCVMDAYGYSDEQIARCVGYFDSAEVKSLGAGNIEIVKLHIASEMQKPSFSELGQKAGSDAGTKEEALTGWKDRTNDLADSGTSNGSGNGTDNGTADGSGNSTADGSGSGTADGSGNRTANGSGNQAADGSSAGSNASLVLPADAAGWAAFLTQWFPRYTGCAMDAESLAEIYITFADMTGDGIEEMLVVRPDVLELAGPGAWLLEIYDKDEFGVYFVMYTDMAMNNHAAARRFDLMTAYDMTRYLLVEKHVVGTGVGDALMYDHISLDGGTEGWADGQSEAALRSDDTLLLKLWDDGTLITGGHTIPEYFPGLF